MTDSPLAFYAGSAFPEIIAGVGVGALLVVLGMLVTWVIIRGRNETQFNAYAP